jgi:hypothetical protein
MPRIRPSPVGPPPPGGYCLDRGIEPVWSCFGWNHAGQSVARKLEFVNPVHHTLFK